MALPLAAAGFAAISAGTWPLGRLKREVVAQTLELPLITPFGGVGSLFARAYNKAEEQERTISVTFDGLREEKIFCPHISSKIRYRSSEARLANFRCLLSDKKFF